MADFGGPNQFGQHNNDEFFSALNQLAGNVQKQRISSSIEDANQRVQSIKTSMQPGADQRAALTGTAQDLFMSMMSMGADPNASALVYQNLVPKSYSTIDSALLSGDPYERQAASQIQNEQETRTARRDQEKFSYQMQLTDKLEQGRDNRAEMAANRQQNKALAPMQAKAAGYVSQMVQSNNIYTSKAGGGGTEGNSGVANFLGKAVPNSWKTDAYQKGENAKRQWAIASLRPEAGRPPSEDQITQQVNTYFPVGGEGAAVRTQKAQAREQVHQRMMLEAGPQGMQALANIPGGAAALGTNMVDLSSPNPQFNLGGAKYYTPPGSN
jgi:hypothetical protein